MEYKSLEKYLLSKPLTSLSYPFGDDVSVFKVNNKMFALLGIHKEILMINLKCDPDEGAALRDIYPAITEAYHMDKKHWISLFFDGTVPEGEVLRLIDNSFDLVVSKMTKKDQQVIKLHL